MANVQTYKNHIRWFAPFHFFALPVLLLNVANEVRQFYMDPTRYSGFAVLVAAALFMSCLLGRVQALAAQDRVIRLEMRLRMQALLPADLTARFNDLTVRQLVALRFAGDAELADLVRTALKDKTKEGDLKRMIKQWVPDHVRV